MHQNNGFLPHGFCYLWNQPLLLTHLVADVLIGLSYVTISVALAYLVHRARRDIPFSLVFVAFGLFIITCGMTHFMEVWTLWTPVYWLSGGVKVVTAVASVATAAAMPFTVPRVLTTIRDARLARERELAVQRAAILEEANRYLQEHAAELERQRAAAQALAAELSTTTYAIAHDLRSPLRGLDGYSRILQLDFADCLGDEGRAHLDRIRASSQRMAGMIDGLLSFSRLGREDLRVATVDLGALARSAAADLARAEPERAVDVRVEPGLVVRGDPRLLATVVQNLVGNAWKFTRPRADARIEVGAQQRDGERVYYVRDNGVGFDMAFAGQLFGVFTRLHREEDFEGYGIGLASVKRIIERHGGRVWAEAAPDAGATIYFTLGEARAVPASGGDASSDAAGGGG